MNFFSYRISGEPPAEIRPRDAFQTHEDFVRWNWRRPGVVADGVTLVDLYDRIRALEARVHELEGR